jgi:hypothetical protein
MTLKTCLRCDWQGKTKELTCPNCRVPLYVVGSFPPEPAGMPVSDHPEERSREEASTPSTAPPTQFPQSDPPPSPTNAGGSPSRSTRSALAFVLIAIALTVSSGIWLKAGEEPSAPVASTDAAVHESPASEGLPAPVASMGPTPAGVFPAGDLIPSGGRFSGRHSLTVEGIPFSFSVPTHGWEPFGSLLLSKSSVGPQGAEAVIFWTGFPDGTYADPCGHLAGPPAGSAADLAAAVSTAPGTELLTGPSDIVVGGRAAKHVVLTVREDVGCDPGFFYNWKAQTGGAMWEATRLGDVIRVWIVEVDGVVLFIEGETNKDGGPELEQEIQQIVESILFSVP